MADLRLEIPKRGGETDTLYGSVTATELADLLERRGFTVDRRRIDLEGGIKTLREHQGRIGLHPQGIAEGNVTGGREEEVGDRHRRAAAQSPRAGERRLPGP